MEFETGECKSCNKLAEQVKQAGTLLCKADNEIAALEQRCRELEESCEDWRKNCLAYIEGLNMTEKRLEEIEAENALLKKRLEKEGA